MKNTKWFWGLIILGAGILLILSALGIGEEIGLLRVIGSALLLGISVESLVKSRFFLFPIPLALAVYLWRDTLGFADLNLTLLLIAAVVVGIGLSILFHKKQHHEFTFHGPEKWKDAGTSFGQTETQEILGENELINLEASFSEQIKYIHATNLKRANLSSNFAEMVVYFDQCQISEEGLTIHISGNFTEMVLNVPRAWAIENQVSVFAASVNTVNEKAVEGKAKVLLNGSINFGELKIVYI